jgi:hypothetical protein
VVRFQPSVAICVAGSAAFVADHVHQHADVGGGRRGLRRPYGQSRPERMKVRNGHRHGEFDTRVGTVNVAIPKLREGSYFPDWLLERRRRAERALTTSEDLTRTNWHSCACCTIRPPAVSRYTRRKAQLRFIIPIEPLRSLSRPTW